MSPKRTTGKTMLDDKIRESHLPIGFICQTLNVDPKQMLNYRTGKTAPPYDLLVRLANLLTDRGVPCTADDLKEKEYRPPGRPRKAPERGEPRPLFSVPYVAPLEFTDAGPLAKVPAYRYIAAGPLSDEALELEEEPHLTTAEYADCKALRVRGNSMEDADIFDGSVVLVRLTDTAKPGDIVLAEVGNGSTIKTYAVRRGKPFLKAESRRHKDIHPTEGFTVRGVVVAVSTGAKEFFRRQAARRSKRRR